MKIAIVSVMLFIFVATLVHAELTKEDLEEIRKIVKESEDRLRAELKDDIADLKWMVGLMFGGIIGIIAATLAIPQITGKRREQREIEELRERIIRIEAKQGI